jgi:ribonuclease PH
MILPKIRDPRLITIRRGGTLTDADHHLLALWAADCAEHVLVLFEAQRPEDARPRFAIEQARAWARGEVPMMQARAAGGHAMAAARQEVVAARQEIAARDLSGAARFAAFAAGQAAVTAHVAAHDLGAAAYAIKAAAAALQEAQARRRERDWQREQLPDAIRALVLDDQRRRNAICWFVFFDD